MLPLPRIYMSFLVILICSQNIIMRLNQGNSITITFFEDVKSEIYKWAPCILSHAVNTKHSSWQGFAVILHLGLLILIIVKLKGTLDSLIIPNLQVNTLDSVILHLGLLWLIIVKLKVTLDSVILHLGLLWLIIVKLKGTLDSFIIPTLQVKTTWSILSDYTIIVMVELTTWKVFEVIYW